MKPEHVIPRFEAGDTIPQSGPVVIATSTRARFLPRARPLGSRVLVWVLLVLLAAFWLAMLVLWKGLP